MASILLADIGGTNARFAFTDGAGHTPPVSLPLAGFTGVAPMVAAVLAGRPPPAAALFAVAGPVRDNAVRLTNRGWVVAGAAVAAACGIARVRVVNDFEPLAFALPRLAGAELFALGGGAGAAGAPMAVLGPGTGLGIGAFLPPDRALVTEGGHASLATQTPQEAAVADWLRARHGHVSAERVLSGAGIEAVHAALGGAPGPDAAAITQAALAGTDARCGATLALFCALLGSLAGDLALLYGARGGVFVAGGICPRFPGFLAASEFRARFEAKGRFREWLAPIPTWLVMRPDPAMLGLAAMAETLA